LAFASAPRLHPQLSIEDRVVNQPHRRGSFHGVGLGVTAAIAMVICCAAPALLAGGLLASLGAVAGNPLVIALGLAVVAGAVVFALVHRSRHTSRPPESDPVATSADEAGHPWSSMNTGPTKPRRGRTP